MAYFISSLGPEVSCTQIPSQTQSCLFPQKQHLGRQTIFLMGWWWRETCLIRSGLASCPLLGLPLQASTHRKRRSLPSGEDCCPECWCRGHGGVSSSWPLQPKIQQLQGPLPFHKAPAQPRQYSVCGFLACSCLMEDSQPGRIYVHAEGVGICCPCGVGGEQAISSMFSLWERMNGVGQESPRVLILGGRGDFIGP